MKKKILIFGLTSNRGGMEKITADVLTFLNVTKYSFYFVNSCDSNLFIDDKLKDFDIHVIRFNSKRRNRYKSFKAGIEQIFKDIDPDIVLEVFGDSTYFEPLYYAKKYNVKKRIALATMGDYNEKPSLRHKLITGFARYLINKSTTHYLSVSQKSSTFTFGKYKKSIIISGIKAADFKFNTRDRLTLRKKYGVSGDSIVFSEIGRICPDKNQLYALKTFYSYHKTNNNSFLFFIGNYEQEYFDLLSNKINELELTKHVFFIKAQDNIQSYYSFSDIVLFPSLREGFGLVPLESQANGVPCFAFSETIDRSLVVTDNLYLVEKNIDERHLNDMINRALKSGISNRLGEYLRVEESNLDFTKQKNQIRSIFE